MLFVFLVTVPEDENQTHSQQGVSKLMMAEHRRCSANGISRRCGRQEEEEEEEEGRRRRTTNNQQPTTNKKKTNM